MYELRWVYASKGRPPQFAISIGEGPQQVYQVLQFRVRENPLEEGLHQAIYSEWKNV